MKKKIKPEPTRFLFAHLGKFAQRCLCLQLAKDNQTFEPSYEGELGYTISVPSKKYEEMRERYVNANKGILCMEDDEPILKDVWNVWVTETSQQIKQMLKAANLIKVFGQPSINHEDVFEPYIEFPTLNHQGIEIVPAILKITTPSILGDMVVHRKGYKIRVWDSDGIDHCPYQNALLSEVLTYLVSEHFGAIFNEVMLKIMDKENNVET